MKKFEVENVELSGSNLIEASAGTGKTYSIAILMLRLLLEKEIPIDKILMVTFTKAAVAELEERIRIFVRDAEHYSLGKEIKDDTIRSIVDKIGKENAHKLLKKAVVSLDETSVMTIHGFCQQTLNEFAFETNQVFTAELMQDTSALVEEELQRYWRENITVIRADLLRFLIDIGLNQEEIQGILKGHLDGKNYIFYDENENYILDAEQQNGFYNKIELVINGIENTKEEIWQKIQQNRNVLKQEIENNRYAKNTFVDLLDDRDGLINKIIELLDKKYVQKIFADFLQIFNDLVVLEEDFKNLKTDCVNFIFSSAIQSIVPKIEERKATYNIISFDDMISKLHYALTENDNYNLKQKLQGKYQAVFIDEFQDTDRLQYEIFYTAFQNESETIIFYIGDPKQSIYGWRKADIATYLKARNEVNHQYTMNTNYRSTPQLVRALNNFFLPYEEFDTFYFGETEKSHRFDYTQVNYSKRKENKQLLIGSEEIIPLTLTILRNKGNIVSDLALRVLDVLTNPKYYFYDKMEKESKAIKASDIGILVRNKKDAVEIKKALAKKGIPAVTITDTKILETKEAGDMSYLLEAFISNTVSNVNRALMTDFVGLKVQEILTVNEEIEIENFKKYNEYWKNNGVYATLMKFVSDYQLQQKLIAVHTENGERILTNLYHLAELLYKTESRQKLSPAEVLDWLKINVQKQDVTEDEWIQRIESDDDAVKIATIHSSKGLQYPIVFAPTLDFNLDNRVDRIYGFRNEDGNYVTAKYGQLNETQQELLKEQNEQENRRLLYVALTRAEYKCFIYRSIGGGENSTLKAFIDDLVLDDDLIEVFNEGISLENLKVQRYKKASPQKQTSLIANNFKRGYPWVRMSYSGLAAELSKERKPILTEEKEDYDTFVFKKLAKGAKTGDFLHAILERINFNEADRWQYIVEKELKAYLPNPPDGFVNNILLLLENVMQANVNGFNLSNVEMSKTLHELEFDFPVQLFSPQKLSRLKENGVAVTDKFAGQIEGMMNGKIDLFFLHDNKYYILDWKSNYLGPDIGDYHEDLLEVVMTESNYHLQYLIYTYAITKHLTQKLGDNFNYERDFGGVIYIFLRGARSNQSTGVYFTKPTLEQLEIMSELFEEGLMM